MANISLKKDPEFRMDKIKGKNFERQDGISLIAIKAFCKLFAKEFR